MNVRSPLLAACVCALALAWVPSTQASSPYEQAKRAIQSVFGPYAGQALHVAKCETGGTYSVWAGYHKHEYWGLFQMGDGERARYGHGWNAWAQAKAAYRYFVASGKDWSPWDWRCRP